MPNRRIRYRRLASNRPVALKLIGIPPPFQPDANGYQPAPDQVRAVPGVVWRGPPIQDVRGKNIDGQYQQKNQTVNVHRSEEHTSELQSRPHLVCRLLLEKKK